jgi:predicted DNA binding CopG/RHH family protein
MKKLKTIPYFKSEQEERKFWQTHSSVDYVDYSTAKRVSFPNLKLTSERITIRIPKVLLDRLKIRAHKLDIPYQSYIKQILASSI